MGQQTAKMAQASISFTSKKMLFLLAALVVAAYAQGPISTTCLDLKSSYQNNSCCSQDTGKAATFNGTNVTCGNVLASYKSSECCSADEAKNATMTFPTNAPTNAPSSIPSSEPTSIPSSEPSSMPSNGAVSCPATCFLVDMTATCDRLYNYCGVESGMPEWSPGCQETGGRFFVANSSCADLEADHGCDCSGCACAGG